MIIRIKDAIREALDEIQELGYVVLSAHDKENVEIIWMAEKEPPNIDPQIEIIETDQKTLEKVLSERTVPVPLWLLLGYPWEHPRNYWRQMAEIRSHGPRRSRVSM